MGWYAAAATYAGKQGAFDFLNKNLGIGDKPISEGLNDINLGTAMDGPQEAASAARSNLQTNMIEGIQPTLSKIFAGDLPEGVKNRVMGYGDEIAGRQADALAGRFQQAGMAFTNTHAGAEATLRSDVARQTEESLADLQFRMQSSALGQILGMPVESGGKSGWMDTATGLASIYSMFA